MSNDVIISVENLGKRYRIQHNAERQRYTALRDVLAEKAKGIFRNLKPEKLQPENSVSVSTAQRISGQTSGFRSPVSVLRGFLGLAGRFVRGQTRGSGG